MATRRPKTGRRPRSQALPGLENRALRPLERIATAYADLRDRRMELTREEVELKHKALTLMKKFGKSTYKRDGIEIEVVAGEEKIRVRVAKDAEPADGAVDDMEGAELRPGVEAEH